jgi:hypothetical protein
MSKVKKKVRPVGVVADQVHHVLVFWAARRQVPAGSQVGLAAGSSPVAK